MSDPSSHSSTPIDAEFEPADTPAKTSISYEKAAPKSAGPGWVALTAVGLLALGNLGFSVWSSGILTTSDSPGAVEESVSGLQAEQATLQQKVAELSAQLEGTIDRVNGEIARVETEMAAIEPAIAEPLTLPEDMTPFEARMAALEEQMTTLSTAEPPATIDPARIEAIETALQAASANSGGTSSAQLVSLQAELETLKSDLAALQLSQQLLTDQIDAARTDAQAIGTSSARMISASLALDAIEAKAARGESFVTEYQQLAEARPDDPDVTTLDSLSRIAIPTPGELKASFRDLRTGALTREPTEGGLGWVNSVFGDNVSVRRTDTASDAVNRLTDAEAALARDDFAVAIDQIEAMPETVKPVFQTWLADARRRARLEQSLETLRLKLITAGQ